MAMETMAIVSVAMYPRPPLDQNKKVLIEISFRSSTMSTPILVVTPYYVVVMNEYNKINTHREGRRTTLRADSSQ